LGFEPGSTDYGAYFVDDILSMLPTDGGYNYDVTKLYERDGNWGTEDLMREINEGINFLIHMGHGKEDKTMKMTEGDCLKLTNSGKPFFLSSEACSIGWFDWEKGDCWAEFMGPKNPNGAFALVVNSRESPNLADDSVDAFECHRLSKHFWFYAGEGVPLGKALMEAKYDLWDEAKNNTCMRVNIYELNLLGDPTVSLASAPHKPPEIINMSVRPNPAKVDEVVYFNATTRAFDGCQVVNWTWQIKLNSSSDGNPCWNPESDPTPIPPSNYTVYLYGNGSANVTFVFPYKGVYNISLAIRDDVNATATKYLSKPLTVNIQAILYSNTSILLNPYGVSPVWLPHGLKLLDISFEDLDEQDEPVNSTSENSPVPVITIRNVTPCGVLGPLSVGEAVTFEIEVENGSGNHYVIMDFGDDSGYSDYMGFSETIVHVYNSTGTFTVDVEVHDLETCFYDSWYGFVTIMVEEDTGSNDI
ncbi:MAG TPA: hypothetical protein ENI42_04355, partial [Thermoplasmatales archaeon]|nr:hypothetical protein [Thermoplasmatales archaeon]